MTEFDIGQTMDKKTAYRFSKIYDTYSEQIYRFIYIKVDTKETAEDLTSDVFVRFWRTFQKDGQDRIENPKAFLYRMAKNTIVDFYRGRPVLRPLSDQDVPEMADKTQELEKKEMILSDQEQIMQALKTLKDEYQDMILWYYLDQMPVPEIAEITNKSENAVRVTIFRAMEELRKLFPKDTFTSQEL